MWIRQFQRLWGFVIAVCGLASGLSQTAGADLSIELHKNQLVVLSDSRPVAVYVFRDPDVLRPYFKDLCAPNRIQVTRNHPPIEGRDATDHGSMHPGLWMAFGDVNGHDFWRNQAEIRHERFIQPPRVQENQVTVCVENRFCSPAKDVIGRQVSQFSFSEHPGFYLLIWETEFCADQGRLVFGDQEEMGLGVRLTTKLTEENGGLIQSSTGRRTAEKTWGQAADWCDYSATIDGRRVGVAILCDPGNFRSSWWHNRDYGLMVANPFGRAAMKQGPASQVTVQPNQTLRLRFGVVLHSGSLTQDVELAEVYRQFLKPTNDNAVTAPDRN